ncbi:hypothetical protein O7614_23165 [Micromonospora sp. WMMD961]|uniref:hypothetical protein n=1 Tax=Micromonospora sp. WMMD961 TaxID=3016100 RepID=UPI002417A0E3|nr:hypothetical protein [Micromonospora sp. WMMD961]MDG4782564.1 hypothetical protein [Micromonospora sp. WMMD961]
MRSTTIRRGLVAVVAMALLTGCGDGNGDGGQPASNAPADNGVAALAPDEALQRATTAVKNAKSYRLAGDIDNDGQKMTLDFKMTGSDLAGQVSTTEGTVELLSVAGQQYIRPDEKFWAKNAGAQASGEIVKLMGDKWAKVSEKDDFTQLFDVANVEQLLKPDGTMTKGEAKEIDGVKTVGLVDGDKNGTLYIATTGEPYPVRMEGGQDAAGQITFSDFGATFDELKAPAADQVVDFDQLKRA